MSRMRRLRRSSQVGLCLALAGCGGDARFDPGSADVSGPWSTRVDNITGPTGAEPIVCSAVWTMLLQLTSNEAAPESYATRLPLDAMLDCSNGYSVLFAHRGLDLVITRDGGRLTFIAETSRDTFAVTTLVERGLMQGRLGEKFYGGGELTARR